MNETRVGESKITQGASEKDSLFSCHVVNTPVWQKTACSVRNSVNHDLERDSASFDTAPCSASDTDSKNKKSVETNKVSYCLFSFKNVYLLRKRYFLTKTIKI